MDGERQLTVELWIPSPATSPHYVLHQSMGYV